MPPEPIPRRYATVGINDIQPFPGNPRIGDRPTLHRSLSDHGQFDDLIVQESTGYIIAGNNTWHTMHDDGAEQVTVMFIDVDDEKARRLNLVHNRAGDKSTYDDRLLVEMLGELPDLDGTGYTEQDLDDLAAGLEEVSLPDDLDADGNMKERRSLDDKHQTYETSEQRSIVLAYEGERYVWMVEQLTALGQERGTDTNAETVLQLVQAATGETAPEVGA